MLMVLTGTLLSGCVQKPQEQQPPVKTTVDLALDIVYASHGKKPYWCL